MSGSPFRAADERGRIDDSALLGPGDISDPFSTSSAASPQLLSPRHAVVLAVATVLVALLAVVLSAVSVSFAIAHSSAVVASPIPAVISSPRTSAELEACIARHSTFKSQSEAAARAPDNSTPPILIKNALIHDGLGPAFLGDVLLEGGLIHSVARSLSPPSSTTRVMDVRGRHLTPGIVDAHSHVGVSAFPTDYVATSDTNEGTNPIFPQVRAVDAVDVRDPAIALVRSGGVTTVQILPGSGHHNPDTHTHCSPAHLSHFPPARLNRRSPAARTLCDRSLCR